MSFRFVRAGLSGFAVALLPISQCAAHVIVGNRFFPATLTVDDPGVNDELEFPTVDGFNTGDTPSVRQRDVSGEFSKRITEDFAVSFGSAYTWLRPTDLTAGAAGFQNLDTTFKYQLYQNSDHEFVMSFGLGVEWGRTGSSNVGADRFNTYTPSLYFGKGLGDLPDTLSWIRPVAITGQLGYAIPGQSSTTAFGLDPLTGNQIVDTEFNPRVWAWGGSIQYSMPYLKSAVKDLSLPDFINHLIPLVEANLQTPVANTFTSGTLTTGTVSPGVIWVGQFFQVGVEALIPINRQSGSNVGVIAQLHYYLDDIDPHGIGKPLFASSADPATPFAR